MLLTQRKFVSLLLVFSLSLGLLKAQPPMMGAYRMQPASQGVKTDTLWGAYCYREINGQTSGVTREKRPFENFPLHDGEKMVYYVLADKSSATLILYLHTEKKAQPLISVKMTEVNTGKTICDKLIKTKFKGGQSKAFIMQNAKLPSKSWYRIELTSQNWLAINSIDFFKFEHDSPIGIKPSPIFMAPSVHLTGWESTDPSAPKGEAYDWAYMEVMFPKKYERKNTYIMSLGVLSGYMGIQSIDDEGKQNYKHRVLFSMWDKGDTDADANLPEYMRSGALDNETGVKINRFGGEGTGTQSIIYNSHWQCDNWVQFITTCRPEKVNVTVKDRNGRDSVIEYTNTLVTAWYKEANEKEWHYLSTLREAGRNHYMAGWYSFLENFTDDGGNFYRRAYFRNGYFHSLTDNKWYNRNKVGFGHTQGKPNEPRYDYGHGATDLYPNCFYLEQGGYTLEANDSATTVPLATDYTPVDTINLAALWSRVEQAIRKEQTNNMNLRIAGACEQSDKLAALKSLAKEYIDNSDKFGYYAKSDLKDLETTYQNGNTTDAAGLAMYLEELAKFGNPLKFGKAIKVEHIGSTRGYQIVNSNDMALAADKNGATFLKGDIATDNSRNWRFTRVGNTNRFTVCNIKTGQYLDPQSNTMLSSSPKEITLTAKPGDAGFIISVEGKQIDCNLIDNYFVKHIK